MHTSTAPESLNTLNEVLETWKKLSRRAQERARTTAAIMLHVELSERGVASFDIFSDPDADLILFNADGSALDVVGSGQELLKKLVKESDLYAWISGDVFWAGDAAGSPFSGVHSDRPATRVELSDFPDHMLVHVIGDVPVRQSIRALNLIAR